MTTPLKKVILVGGGRSFYGVRRLRLHDPKPLLSPLGKTLQTPFPQLP